MKSETIDIEDSIKWAIELESSVTLPTLEVFESLSYDSMFRPVNFELVIDYHRRVKEYLKGEEEKKSKVKKILTVSLTLAAVGVVLAYKYKKLGFLGL